MTPMHEVTWLVPSLADASNVLLVSMLMFWAVLQCYTFRSVYQEIHRFCKDADESRPVDRTCQRCGGAQRTRLQYVRCSATQAEALVELRDRSCRCLLGYSYQTTLTAAVVMYNNYD